MNETRFKMFFQAFEILTRQKVRAVFLKYVFVADLKSFNLFNTAS